MSRDLSPEVLSGLKTRYNSDRTAKAVRRALNKTDIMEKELHDLLIPVRQYLVVTSGEEIFQDNNHLIEFFTSCCNLYIMSIRRPDDPAISLRHFD